MASDRRPTTRMPSQRRQWRSEEHTSELQSHSDLVCRLLLEKKKNRTRKFLSRPILTSRPVLDCNVNVSLARRGAESSCGADVHLFSMRHIVDMAALAAVVST